MKKKLGALGQRGGIVGKHDAMFTLLEFVKIEQPLFGSKAVDELEVSLPVLDAILSLGVLVFQGKGVVGDAVLLQQDAEDFIRLLCLEDARVLAQSQSPQGRFDVEAITGTAKAAVPLGKYAHYPADPALQLAVVPHQQLAGLVQHSTEVDVRLVTGYVQLEAKRAV